MTIFPQTTEIEAAAYASAALEALDLFGCDDRAPYARIDAMGAWLVSGNRVVNISSSAAVIEMRTRSRQTDLSRQAQ